MRERKRGEGGYWVSKTDRYNCLDFILILLFALKLAYMAYEVDIGNDIFIK